MLLRVASAIGVLSALGGVGEVGAQSRPQDWKALYEAGVEAEDQAEDKKAEAFYHQACTLAQAGPNAGPEVQACIRLIGFQAAAGNLKSADRSAQSLVESLEARDDPALLVLALLEAADVLTARTRHDIAVLRLKRAAGLLSKVAPIERIEAVQRMSLYYAAIGRGKDALELASRAQAEVVPMLDFKVAAPIRALANHVRLLNTLERHRDALEVLDPVVRGIDHRMQEFDRLDLDLQEAYVDVIGQVTETLEYAGAGEAARRPYEERRDAMADKIKPLAGKLFRGTEEGVEAPRIKSMVEPVYPDGARASGAAGSVELILEIWPDGRPHRIRPARQAPYGFTAAAVAALRRWRFYPGVRNGVPVRVQSRVQVNFRLR